jgi:hypothetical protein
MDISHSASPDRFMDLLEGIFPSEKLPKVRKSIQNRLFGENRLEKVSFAQTAQKLGRLLPP